MTPCTALPLLDLAGLEAAGAHVDPSGRAVDDRPDPLHVRVPTTLVATVRVAETHAEVRTLAAHFADGRHGRTSERVDRTGRGTRARDQGSLAGARTGTSTLRFRHEVTAVRSAYERPRPVGTAGAAHGRQPLPGRTACPSGGAQPAERVSGARWRHRHEHGPHARVGHQRDRARKSTRM